MIDSDRLRRAVHLDVSRCGAGWLVIGGTLAHRVDEDGVCDCRDQQVRGGRCKHALAVALSNGDADVRLALREIVALPRPQRHRVTAEAHHARV